MRVSKVTDKNQYDWRYENSINWDKNYLETEGLIEHKYVPWRTNSSLSNFPDTILLANEMNMAAHLDARLQYDFLFHSVRKRKRFFKKERVNKSPEHSLVQSVYKYNDQRTKEALRVLTNEQLEIIRKKQEKGGT